jgi:hypothetical protein
MRAAISLCLACSCLVGCINPYPMGLTREQWEAIPPERQAEYKAQQYAIDAQRREQAEARRLELARAERARVQAEQERVRQVYASARYGDIVRVSIQGGALQYGGKRYPYDPVSFELAKGETKEIPFRGRGSNTVNTMFRVRLSDDGNTLYFDDSDEDRFVLINQTWDEGQHYGTSRTVNDVSVGLAGASFFVKFKDLPGGPQRLIIEHR